MVFKVNFNSIFKAVDLLFPMASFENKKKLAAVDSDSREENPRKIFSKVTTATRKNERYTTQDSEEI